MALFSSQKQEKARGLPKATKVKKKEKVSPSSTFLLHSSLLINFNKISLNWTSGKRLKEANLRIYSRLKSLKKQNKEDKNEQN